MHLPIKGHEVCPFIVSTPDYWVSIVFTPNIKTDI